MKYTILAIITCIGLLSCKKDSSESTGSNKTELLTTGTWVYESGGADIDKNGSIDITLESTGAAPVCLLNNIASFKADKTGVNDEGPTKCDPALPQTTSFTWDFVNNETGIAISGAGFAGISGQFKITTLTSSRFTVSKDTSISSIPATLIVNLKH